MAKYYYDKYNKDIFANGVLYTDLPANYGTSSDNVIAINTYNWTSGSSLPAMNMIIGNIYCYYTSTNWDKGNPEHLGFKKGTSPYVTQSKYSPSQVGWGKTTLVESDIKAEDGTYPTNGVHSDGYWYTKGNKASLPIYQNVDGEWKEITDGYIKISGEWKQIVGGYQKQNGSWKKLF